MSLHALVEKWREAAKSERIIAVTTPGIDKYACQVQARLMDKFADELEAALAGGGEAVAWMDHMGGVITAAMKNRDPGLPYNIPLFTHPAGAVPCVWTYDEYSYAWDSSCGAKYSFVDGGPDDNGHKFCHSCGKPLALNPGGSRE